MYASSAIERISDVSAFMLVAAVDEVGDGCEAQAANVKASAVDPTAMSAALIMAT